MEDNFRMDIQAMIENSDEGLLSPYCCIYKVPQSLRDLKPDAYTPKVVSIGPFHYGNPRLQEMEMHKQILFKRFMKRCRTSLEELVNLVEDSKPKVQASYLQNINLTAEQLMKLILVDAAFIVELFLMYQHLKEISNDAKLSNPRLMNDIRMDLVLLENQLPFFFLENLFNQSLIPDDHSFHELTIDFFEIYNIQYLKPKVIHKIKHFTDLLRLFYLPEKQPSRQSIYEHTHYDLLYGAKQLEESGVKFKASKRNCLLEFEFSGHILEIPQISVHQGTESLFRNMIALEQCHYFSEHYITDFAILLAQMITSTKDLDVLVHNKVVHNLLGDTSDVAKLIIGLNKEVAQYGLNSVYSKICRRLNEFYEDPWHKKKAALIPTLRRDYFETPWRTVASISGIILLILTIIQTIFSIFQVVLK